MEMDFDSMVEQLNNPVTIGLFVLLVVSEVLGSNEKVRASSIYTLVVAVLPPSVTAPVEAPKTEQQQ
jgi:hypothetical protein